MSKQISCNALKKAKKKALAEAKRRSKGRSESYRHRLFVELWEADLSQLVREVQS